MVCCVFRGKKLRLENCIAVFQFCRPSVDYILFGTDTKCCPYTFFGLRAIPVDADADVIPLSYSKQSVYLSDIQMDVQPSPFPLFQLLQVRELSKCPEGRYSVFE
ncbi:hypothetical protein AVEN_18234-1 [Araneus ventricosus]|uniref:Uncharacterized protein n=1 Tax=Araneus ventricosus TaxID=182803 RepID=A0A4Y2AKH4_ARAVE|nr:hypothetical protein AVEN_18234-1 [Araneus ventricosus]